MAQEYGEKRTPQLTQLASSGPCRYSLFLVQSSRAPCAWVATVPNYRSRASEAFRLRFDISERARR